MVLSIIIPVFNVEAYIRDCLLSIFTQDADPANFEVLVVNDGTRDHSMSVVADFQSGYKNLRVIEQQNEGLSSARMKGLSVAKGDYIWFIDSDDSITPHSISEILGIIKTGGGALDVIVFPLQWLYPDGVTKNDFAVAESHIKTGRELLHSQSLPVWAAPRFIVKKPLFENKALFFPKGLLHEDEYFGRVLLYLAKNVRVENSPKYIYRQNSASITHVGNIKSSYDIVSLYKLLSQFYGNEVREEDKMWFRSQITGFLLESYTKMVAYYGTQPFNDFLHHNRRYILHEYNQNCSGFNRNRIIADRILIIMPSLHKLLFPSVYRKTN